MLQIDLKKFLWLKKLKILCSGYMLLIILKGKKFLERITKNDSKKQIKNIFKRIKRKGIRLYVKWKGYNSSFNSWFAKRDIV